MLRAEVQGKSGMQSGTPTLRSWLLLFPSPWGKQARQKLAGLKFCHDSTWRRDIRISCSSCLTACVPLSCSTSAMNLSKGTPGNTRSWGRQWVEGSECCSIHYSLGQEEHAVHTLCILLRLTFAVPVIS